MVTSQSTGPLCSHLSLQKRFLQSLCTWVPIPISGGAESLWERVPEVER